MEENLRGNEGFYLSHYEVEKIIPTLKGAELKLYLQLKGLSASNSPICPSLLAQKLGFSLTTYYRYLKRLKQKQLLTSTKHVQVVSFIQFTHKEAEPVTQKYLAEKLETSKKQLEVDLGLAQLKKF